jgi:hypothetical protein
MSDTNILVGLELAKALLEEAKKEFLRGAHYHGSMLCLMDQEAADDYAAAIAAITGTAAELQRLQAELAARQAPAEHLYAGDCPDSCQPDARDPACPACCAMVAAPQPPAVTDERQQFERWAASSRAPFLVAQSARTVARLSSGDYEYRGVQQAWEAWQERAHRIGTEPARPCLCGPDGCSDSTALPREGGAA